MRTRRVSPNAWHMRLKESFHQTNSLRGQPMRSGAVGHSREPVTGGECRALSRSKPVAGIQGGAQRRRRASRPIDPDHRTPSSAPRTPKGRDRESEQPGARRRRQSSPPMSALTISIAHELGQPLSSMIHNAQAGRMMITADRSTPDAIGEILSDIETQGVQATQIVDRHRTMLRGHQLDTKPIDLHAVIDESLAPLPRERSTYEHHGVRAQVLFRTV